LAAIAPVLAANVIEALPAGNVSDAGTVKAVAELDSGTTAEAVGDLDRVTVQEVLALDVNVVASHCTEETTTGETRATKAVCENPSRVAVIVAF
jgi:hypothetical protein